ncbi:hypothetical protein LJR175_008385 [Variovorax sp. LjRoot175]|uniref:hypothetical protein n=1 Tax=Variovorax sp. LjRoot175 TaxID=3342276 RepID=UPI003ED12D1A
MLAQQLTRPGYAIGLELRKIERPVFPPRRNPRVSATDRRTCHRKMALSNHDCSTSMNPASRVLAVVQEFQGIGTGPTISSGWKKVLQIDGGNDVDDEVFAAAQAFLTEVRLIQSRLKEIGVPESLFSTHAARLRNAFNPTQLGAQWQSHRDAVAAEAGINALQWASWTLKHFDDNDIDAESFIALNASLAEQERLLAETTLPMSLRAMLERQASTLKAALRLYKIQGVTPLREAVHTAVGEIISENKLGPEALRDATPEAKNAVQRGLLVLTKVAEVADKGSKVAKFAKEMYEWSVTGLGYVQSLYPTLPPSPTGYSA